MLLRLKLLTVDDQSSETGRYIANYWATFWSCWLLLESLAAAVEHWATSIWATFRVLLATFRQKISQPCWWRNAHMHAWWQEAGCRRQSTGSGWLAKPKQRRLFKQSSSQLSRRPTCGHVHATTAACLWSACLGLYTTFTTRRKQTCCPLNTKWPPFTSHKIPNKLQRPYYKLVMAER